MRTPEPHTGKDGTVTWKIRFRLDGKQTSESFDARKDAAKFAQLLDALGPRAALERLYADQQRGPGPTVGEIAEKYFAFKESRVRSDRTIADYRRDYRNWIAPTFGGRQVDTLTEVSIQQWVDAMGNGSLGRQLSPKSIADRHGLLFAIYKWASAPSRSLVKHNPCIGTELPERTKKPPKGLRPAEWQALYPALQQVDPDGADLALFLISTGWRFSEAAALSAFGVEDYGSKMVVSMDQVIRRNANGQHVIVQDAKSEASEGRRAKLDAEAAAMVRRRLERVTGDALVFTNAGGNQWHYSNFLNRIWNKAVKLAGLTRRPTPHWLRHTHVAWLVLGGKVSLPEIQRRIGHESITTTIDVYGRMIDDVSEEALDGFAAFRAQQLPAAVRAELEET